jgi:hypothetical protein
VTIVARGFGGPGTYPITTELQGTGAVVEAGDLAACAVAHDPRCYVPSQSECELRIDSFATGAGGGPAGAPAAVKWGAARGTFSCDRLQNGASRRFLAVTNGAFECAASDWSEFE